MSTPSFLVTGATGKTGRLVVAALRARNLPVRALVHRVDGRSDALAALGAEIALADLFDTEQLAAALRGVQRAYYCAPWHPRLLDSAIAFAEAAQAARLEHVVGLSQWIASPSHPALTTRLQWLADRQFERMRSVSFTRVEPGFFADNYLRLLPYAAHLGVFPMPLDPDGRNAPPSNEDIAAVAVAALLDPARHAGHHYRPTGPTLLSTAEIVATMGRVLGRTVRMAPVPMWLFYKAARYDGTEPGLLADIGFFLRDHDQGAFALGAPSTDVEVTTGRPAEPFEATARRYAAGPEVAATPARRLAFLAAFLTLPLRPGFHPERYRRRHGIALPARATQAVDSASWRNERRPAPQLAGAAATGVAS
jgi:uncharacterized protein YbjT (DUF2867 family)